MSLAHKNSITPCALNSNRQVNCRKIWRKYFENLRYTWVRFRMVNHLQPTIETLCKQSLLTNPLLRIYYNSANRETFSLQLWSIDKCRSRWYRRHRWGRLLGLYSRGLHNILDVIELQNFQWVFIISNGFACKRYECVSTYKIGDVPWHTSTSNNA